MEDLRKEIETGQASLVNSNELDGMGRTPQEERENTVVTQRGYRKRC